MSKLMRPRAGTFALIACGLAMSMPRPMAAQAGPPQLIQIIPSSGPAGAAYPLRATIRGTGFMRTGNRLQFGPVRIANLSSADGIYLTFALPKLVSSKGEVPPMVLGPGRYPVTVMTTSGRSNTLWFMLTLDTS